MLKIQIAKNRENTWKIPRRKLEKSKVRKQKYKENKKFKKRMNRIIKKEWETV